MNRRALLAGVAASLALAPLAARADTQVAIEDPPPGKAQIVFYRRLTLAAGAISYHVREGDTDIGTLSAGTYFVAPVDSGLHTFTVHAERHRDMQIVAEAGETYYVRFELDTGLLLWQPVLTPSEQRLFDEISAHLQLVQPNRKAAEATPPASASPP